MPPDPAFRLSTYLTLAVACACLGYSEAALFPEVGVFAAVVVVALAVIYRLETRVQLLAIPAANKLGAGIGFGVVLWAGCRVVGELRTGHFGGLGWPLFLVALVAPVLMAAVAAKLLRAEKHSGDYWVLHGCGLGAIVLAGAMSERLWTIGLTAVYIGCGVWALTRFALARGNGSVPAITGPAAEGRRGRPGAAPGLPPAVWAGSPGAVLLATAAVAATLPVYLLTPRSSFAKLEFNPQRIEVGYAADQMIDLNRTGELAENPETAFEVAAEWPDGRPNTELSPLQRWRGTVFTHYTRGSWRRDTQTPFPTPTRTALKLGVWVPPDLGSGAYRLTFTVPTKLKSHFLADPVAWKAGEPPPVADLTPDGPPHAWYPRPDGSFTRLAGLKPAGEFHYVQYTAPPAEPDLGPGFTLFGEVDRALVHNPVAAVKEYADAVLGQAVREDRLPAAVLARDAVWQRPAEDQYEAIARTFSDYLTVRAGLTYTTSVRRKNEAVDPVEDFLLYSKAGHCERFATALALMLRSQGIPAVMVLGFRGCDQAGDGRYVVGQRYAHAWVEALVAHPPPPQPAADRDFRRPPPPTWHWLSLDPTPPQTEGAEKAEKAEGLGAWGQAAIDRYVVHYSPEQQRRVVRTVAETLASPGVLAGVGIVVVLGLLLRTAPGLLTRPRATPVPPATVWFGRLRAVLAAHGYTPGPGETPREFAAAAAAALRRRPATEPFADVPGGWVEAYYQSRFGGGPIPADRRAALETGLEALGRALKADRKGGS